VASKKVCLQNDYKKSIKLLAESFVAKSFQKEKRFNANDAKDAKKIEEVLPRIFFECYFE